MTDATIHLRVPAATKARWVRKSRAAGMRLTDWIIQHVEPPMPNLASIVIPDDVQFSSLRLSRDTQSGDIELDWDPIARICAASGLDVAVFREAPEDNLAGLLTHWYRAHRAAGGAPDRTMDDLIGEADIEDTHGGGLSYPPGRA